MESRFSKKESKHNRLRDKVYHRLVSKNSTAMVGREIDFYDRYGKHRGSMDVCVVEKVNGKTYVDYYEIKSTRSNSCYRKAYKQAKAFYDSYRGLPGVVPRFVVSTPKATWRVHDHF